METAIFTLIGTFLGGLISYLLQKQHFKHQLKLSQEANKTEFMAESTAQHFLRHKAYIDRSFETLKVHLGGFQEDELRKILVRAGAIRTFRKDGTEWWRLLERMDEYIEVKVRKNEEKR